MTKNLSLLLFVAVAIPLGYSSSQSTQHDSTQASGSPGTASAAKQIPQKVYHVGGDVKLPRMIQSFQPQLDQQQTKQLSARKVKRTGSTLLRIVVADDGSVRSAMVFESFDHDLDAKAIEAVEQWKFEPATKKGVPVAVELTVAVNFRLYKW